MISAGSRAWMLRQKDTSCPHEKCQGETFIASAEREEIYCQPWAVQHEEKVPPPYFECIVLDGLNDITEEDLGGEGVAVINDGLRVGAVPAIQLHTATAFGEGSANREGTWLASTPSAPSPAEGTSGTGAAWQEVQGAREKKGAWKNRKVDKGWH